MLYEHWLRYLSPEEELAIGTFCQKESDRWKLPAASCRNWYLGSRRKFQDYWTKSNSQPWVLVVILITSKWWCFEIFPSIHSKEDKLTGRKSYMNRTSQDNNREESNLIKRKPLIKGTYITVNLVYVMVKKKGCSQMLLSYPVWYWAWPSSTPASFDTFAVGSGLGEPEHRICENK